MPGARGEAEVVRLKGPPSELSGLMPMPAGGPGPVMVELEVPGAKPPSLTAVAVPSGLDRVAQLVLALPRTTPPGTYEGRVSVGPDSHRLRVDVLANTSLRLLPERLDVKALPGEELTVEVTVLNLGNVPAEILARYVIGLVDSKGIDRALSRTSGAKLGHDKGRADHLVDEIAAGRGGPARVEVESGSGTLDAGQTRELCARLKLPERLRRGRTYSGVWRLEDAAFSVRVAANGGERSEEEIA
jgi:hypothetical protein